jgi:hypothetical protein
MKQYSQVVSIYTKVTAYFIFILLLEENLAQQPPVALGELIQNLADFFSGFLGRQCREQIDGFVGIIRVVVRVEATIAGAGAVILL